MQKQFQTKAWREIASNGMNLDNWANTSNGSTFTTRSLLFKVMEFCTDYS